MAGDLGGLRTSGSQAVTAKSTPSAGQIGGPAWAGHQLASQDGIPCSRAGRILIRPPVHALDPDGEVTARGSPVWPRRDAFSRSPLLARKVKLQPWSNGKAGTFGGSAGAITQLLLAGTGHTNVSSQHLTVGGPSLYSDVVYSSGVFRKSLVE